MSRPDYDVAAREALRLLGPLPADWVPSHAGIDHDVLIVGGGQTGTALAFALARSGIRKVSVVDAAPGASQAGVWRGPARMVQLRTPKELAGPALDIQGVGFQVWYESRHGREAFAALERIPRAAWADYLDWFREITGVVVRYGARLERIEPLLGKDGTPDRFRLHLREGGEARVETARKVILANGVSGNGRPIVPSVLRAVLEAGLGAHTAERIDFAALRGKTIAVIGAAASAFDAAATALDAGAAAVHLFSRRGRIPATAVLKARGYPGIYDHYHALPDATRWQQAVRYRRAGSTPPGDAVRRVLAFADFHLHLAAVWNEAWIENGKVLTAIHGNALRFDFVIAGTGYSTDPDDRPELAGIAPSVRRWRDQYTPPPALRDDDLAASPYLGTGLEYQEKSPGTAPWLKNLHIYNPAGFASAGLPLGDVPSMRRDLPALVSRISRDLMLADWKHHERRMNSDVPPEFDETLYAAAVYRGIEQA